MDERKDREMNPTKYSTTMERKSERELVVTRTFNGPAHMVRGRSSWSARSSRRMFLPLRSFPFSDA